MNILHLNTFDIHGGAARAAYRIHAALRANGIRSEMLVAQKDGFDENVKCYNIPLLQQKRRFFQKILKLQKTKNPTFHSGNLFPTGIYKEISLSNADVVHFHWIGYDLISIAEVKKISQPIVWTLHDMWAFCGTEHYIDLNSQERFQKGYCSANKPLTDDGFFDVDKFVWRKKQNHWKNIKFYFVGPSKWIVNCVQKSCLFFNHYATVIPNCLDTQLFRPKNKEACRKTFNLEQNKKILLFGADGGGGNPLKGFSVLQEALKILPLKLSKEIQCVVFGEHKQSEKKDINGIQINYIGRIANDEQLALVYNVANVFIIPSMIDNLPNTVMEAMSCGVPCIGFNVGGIPDLIDHKENGFIVQEFSSQQLADGIKWLLSDNNRLTVFGKAARAKVLKSYQFDLIAKKYIDLYRQVLSEHSDKQL